MWTNAIRNCIFVAVGAAALVTVVKLEVAPARAGVVIDDDAAGRRAAAVDVVRAQEGDAGARADAAEGSAQAHAGAWRRRPAPTPAPAAAAVEAATLLTVPDFKGKRLSVAMREARKLGLAVAGTEDGERIRADEASGYRVRRMLTKPGTEVEPGTVIKVAVREIASLGEGY